MCFRESSLFPGQFSYGDDLPWISDVINAMEKPMGGRFVSTSIY